MAHGGAGCGHRGHLRDQGIDFAIFETDTVDRSSRSREALLGDLTLRARMEGLKVDKSALAFVEGGRISFFGTPDLVRYLASGWLPQWTHTLTVA
ncbi:MAG: hypothetical protein AMXMBFR58_36800 [Phycisphaerae bacterium]